MLFRKDISCFVWETLRDAWDVEIFEQARTIPLIRSSCWLPHMGPIHCTGKIGTLLNLFPTYRKIPCFRLQKA